MLVLTATTLAVILAFGVGSGVKECSEVTPRVVMPKAQHQARACNNEVDDLDEYVKRLFITHTPRQTLCQRKA